MKPLVGTWLRFNVVGVAGFAVQTAALEVLLRLVSPHYLAATALAVEFAVLHNFLWHHRWTWAARATTGRGGILKRLAGFHLTQGLWSLVGTLFFMRLLVGCSGLPPALANVLATGLSGLVSIVNFFVLDRYVFTRRLGRRARL